MKALGGKYELAQDDYFGCGAVGWRNLSCGAAVLGAELPNLSLHGRYTVYRRLYPYDTRAYMQIDGRPVTLTRRLALSGSRYSGGGVTLKITKAGTTVKRARRPVMACELA
jgi:hypothetical protein